MKLIRHSVGEAAHRLHESCRQLCPDLHTMGCIPYKGGSICFGKAAAHHQQYVSMLHTCHRVIQTARCQLTGLMTVGLLHALEMKVLT